MNIVPGTLYQVFMYISRSFTFPVFVFQLLDSAKIYLVVSLAAEFFVAEAVGCRQDPHLKKRIGAKGPALTDNKSVCSVFWALTAPVDRPTQLFYISISICCEYTNRRSTAGQSAKMAQERAAHEPTRSTAS